MSLRYPSNDSELYTAVRAETDYDDTPDSLPQTQLETLAERAKAQLELRTGSSAWYSDDGLGFALVAYTCMRAKSSVENVPLDAYNIGDEDVEFRNTDPEDSQQLRQWADDVLLGLNAADADIADESEPAMTNTSEYIGEDYVPGGH